MASLQQVQKEVNVQLSKLSDPTVLLRRLGAQSLGDSKQRIFNEGLNSSGSSIGTYAQSTIAIKRKKGQFSSSNVNLRDTNTLVDSYFWDLGDKNNVQLGFISASRDGVSNDLLIGYLEDEYGDVFALTDGEVSNLDIVIEDFTSKLFA